MESKKIDKTKPKNWVDGDTFAIKIKDTNTEYDGRYIVLNKYIMPEWTSKNLYFRCMITKDNKIPSLENLQDLEFIKTRYQHYIERYYPFDDAKTYEEVLKRKKHLKFYPDKYNYLYSYTIELFRKRKDDYSDFIYLGNKIISPPEDEYQQTGKISFSNYFFKDDLIQKVIKSYENYNLKNQPYTMKIKER